VKNALGRPQTIVLLGGTSDIGLAIVRALLSPATRSVVLAARRPESVNVAALELGGRDVTVDVVMFDALDAPSHQQLIDDLATRHGDLDVVIVAFGQLGEQSDLDGDAAAAAALVQVNFAGAVSASMATAARFREQGHGQLVVLSSVAGERVRKANFVYGSSKAGLDGFAQGLGDSLAGSGASVLVVRPGFVHSSMTAGLKPAPFATTPEAVATATVNALRSGRRIVWVPGILRVVFSVFRHLPAPIWRRMKA
jgi:decaprenylphospho-beta-D-erythro-pentofuranosid-2-ulose 2-reductase